jgi:DNA-binding response OmpR family regulator
LVWLGMVDPCLGRERIEGRDPVRVQLSMLLEAWAENYPGEAATVAEATAAIEDELPDVVLLDVHLGGEAADLLLERLRAYDVRVLLVTGSVELEDYRGRADELLGKPFSPQTLVTAARRLASIGA